VPSRLARDVVDAQVAPMAVSPTDEADRPRRIVVSLAAPSARGVARLILVVAVTVAALYLLYLTRGVIRILAIALFVAIALGPIVDLVQRSGLPRAAAIATVYLALVLLVVGAGFAIVPSSASQVQRLSHDGQRAIANLRDDPTVRRYDRRYHVTAKLEEQLRALPGKADRLSGPLRDVTVGVFGFAASLVTILSIAFLLLLNGRRYATGLATALPDRHGALFARLGPRIYTAVARYVVGNLAISVIAGGSAWVVMTILGLPFALPLALLVAFFDLIPMVGATLAAVVVALFALLVSPTAALIWIFYAAIYQQAENYLIQPLVYRRAVEVNPLATIVAVMAGGSLLGLLGALLAIPVAAAITISLRELRAAG
jgi:predicted PurR-regulated permease PerM